MLIEAVYYFTYVRQTERQTNACCGTLDQSTRLFAKGAREFANVSCWHVMVSNRIRDDVLLPDAT